MRTNVQILKYLWEIGRELPGSWKRKKKILSQVEASVRERVSEHPDADYQKILALFGPPQQIAESCIAEMETAELLQEMQIRQKIFHVILIAVVIVATISAALTVAAYVDHVKDVNGYAVVEIIEVERIEIDKGGE